MRSKHLMLASAAVLVAAMLPAAANAAVCKPRISGSGIGTGVFGAGTENAKAAAIAVFESRAAQRYGKRFSNFSKASSVVWDCKSTLSKAKCVMTAKPCK